MGNFRIRKNEFGKIRGPRKAFLLRTGCDSLQLHQKVSEISEALEIFISDTVWIKVNHIVPYLAHAIEVLKKIALSIASPSLFQRSGFCRRRNALAERHISSGPD